MTSRDDRPISGRHTRTIVTVGIILLVVFIAAAVTFALIASTDQTGTSPGSNTTIEPPPQCFNVVCPPGRDGEKGKDGLNGNNGMCLANPSCEKGEPGNDGADGSDAVCTTCPRGFPGKDGADGVCAKDCLDGAPGVCEQPCINGTQGIPGNDGVCDCFNITAIEFEDLSVTTSTTLSGTIQCTPGTTIDPTCLLVGACPDFSPCDLQAQSLLLDGGTPSNLIMGVFGGMATGFVRLGNPLLGALDHLIDFFNVYANTVFIKSRFGMKIQAGPGAGSQTLNIDSVGGISSQVRVGSAGNIVLNAAYEIILKAGTLHTVDVAIDSYVTTSQTAHTVYSPTIGLVSDYTILQKKTAVGTGGANWMDTNPLQTFECGVPNPTRPSISFHEDHVHFAQSRILTKDPSRFLKVDNLEVLCEGRIKATAGILSVESTISNNVVGEGVCIDDAEGLDLKDTFIHSSTTNQTDIRSTITNNDPGQAVCIDDAEGLDLKDTFVDSSTTGQFDVRSVITNNDISAAVCIDDADGLDLKDTELFSSSTANVTVNSGNTLVVNTILGPGSITINGVTISETGDISTPGSITALGPINQAMSLGTCCTSDLRMKEAITKMNSTTSLERIMSLNPIEYRWKSEILKQDHWMEDKVVRGFGAQDVDKLIPGAVQKREKKVGEIVYPDFHTLDKSEMIPDLIAAFQAIVQQNIELKTRIEILENK